MRRSSFALAALALTLAAPVVRADPGDVGLGYVHTTEVRERERRPELLLTGAVGVTNQSTTGTVAGWGYDSGTSPSLGLNARLLFPIQGCRCLWHGVDLNYAWSNGPSFGAAHEAAWTQHLVDASYAARVELPCLRRGDRRWWVTGTLGMSMRLANAGLGDVARDDATQLNERTSLAGRYDHTALGWRVGGAMEVTFARFLVGVALDLRDLYGIDTDQRRAFLLGASIRIGGDFIL